MGTPHHMRDHAEDARHLLRLKARYHGRPRTSAAFTDEDWAIPAPLATAHRRRMLGRILDACADVVRQGERVLPGVLVAQCALLWRAVQEHSLDPEQERVALARHLERFGLRLEADEILVVREAADEWRALHRAREASRSTLELRRAEVLLVERVLAEGTAREANFRGWLVQYQEFPAHVRDEWERKRAAAEDAVRQCNAALDGLRAAEDDAHQQWLKLEVSICRECLRTE